MYFYSFKDFCHIRSSINERKPNIHSQAIRTVCLFYIQTWWHVGSWLQPLLRPVKAWACHPWPLFENEKSECKTVWVQSSFVFFSVMTWCMKKTRPLKSISSSIRFFCSGRYAWSLSVWSGILLVFHFEGCVEKTSTAQTLHPCSTRKLILTNFSYLLLLMAFNQANMDSSSVSQTCGFTAFLSLF